VSDLKHMPDEIRMKIWSLAERARSDEHFLAQIKADPVSHLVGEGLSVEAARNVLGFGSAESVPDVEGYARCVDTTCWISFCPASCIRWTEIHY
jgi:hypothetical protein